MSDFLHHDADVLPELIHRYRFPHHGGQAVLQYAQVMRYLRHEPRGERRLVYFLYGRVKTRVTSQKSFSTTNFKTDTSLKRIRGQSWRRFFYVQNQK